MTKPAYFAGCRRRFDRCVATTLTESTRGGDLCLRSDYVPVSIAWQLDRSTLIARITWRQNAPELPKACMRKADPLVLDVANRLRVAVELPVEVSLAIVSNKGGMLTVDAPTLGGPFMGDFESVKNQLAMAVQRRRIRSQ